MQCAIIVRRVKWCHYTQHNFIQNNDTQYNDIQHNDTQNNGIQYNNK
jgi:hypothetical protein